jgi:hypothetical protein
MQPPSAMSKQLDRIESAIIGNGHEGLLARTARIEERTTSIDEKVDSVELLAKEAKIAAETTAKEANEAVSKAAKSVSDLATVVAQLDNAVVQHHNTEHLSKLVKKKEFWAILFVAYIGLHVLATYVPNIWDWLAVLLGVPKLVLPLPLG